MTNTVASAILSFMQIILSVIQIILSVLLIGGILLQTHSAGLGGAFGGSDSVDAGYHTRRGAEKGLFNLTVVVAILFVVISFVAFLSI
jgi:preprotein translocase subunit SecG